MTQLIKLSCILALKEITFIQLQINIKFRKKFKKSEKENLINIELKLSNNNQAQEKMLKVFFIKNLAIKQSMRNKFNYNSR